MITLKPQKTAWETLYSDLSNSLHHSRNSWKPLNEWNLEELPVQTTSPEAFHTCLRTKTFYLILRIWRPRPSQMASKMQTSFHLQERKQVVYENYCSALSARFLPGFFWIVCCILWKKSSQCGFWHDLLHTVTPGKSSRTVATTHLLGPSLSLQQCLPDQWCGLYFSIALHVGHVCMHYTFIISHPWRPKTRLHSSCKTVLHIPGGDAQWDSMQLSWYWHLLLSGCKIL